MSTCARCGHELGVGRFCTNCGHKIGEPVPESDLLPRDTPYADAPGDPSPNARPPWVLAAVGAVLEHLEGVLHVGDGQQRREVADVLHEPGRPAAPRPRLRP